MTRARHDLLGGPASKDSGSTKSSKGGGGGGKDKAQTIKLAVAIAVLVIAGAMIAYQVLPSMTKGSKSEVVVDVTQPPDNSDVDPRMVTPPDPPRGPGAGKRATK